MFICDEGNYAGCTVHVYTYTYTCMYSLIKMKLPHTIIASKNTHHTVHRLYGGKEVTHWYWWKARPTRNTMNR